MKGHKQFWSKVLPEKRTPMKVSKLAGKLRKQTQWQRKRRFLSAARINKVRAQAKKAQMDLCRVALRAIDARVPGFGGASMFRRAMRQLLHVRNAVTNSNNGRVILPIFNNNIFIKSNTFLNIP